MRSRIRTRLRSDADACRPGRTGSFQRMRKAAICSLLALSTLVAACGSTSGNPSAVEANTIGGSAPATTERAGARPSETTDDRSDTTDSADSTDTTDAPDTTDRTTTGSTPGTSPADSDF